MQETKAKVIEFSPETSPLNIEAPDDEESMETGPSPGHSSMITGLGYHFITAT